MKSLAGLAGFVRKNRQTPNRADNETASPPPPSPQRSFKTLRKGSTMIAVLAAMLFIGIVTASMVKNTKSQSAASVGYGTMQIMSSTVRSGMIATETYFMDEGRAKASLSMLDTVLNNKNKKFSVFSKTTMKRSDKSAKIPIAAGQQYFSSEMDSAIGKNKQLFARFLINSGRNEGGRNLKKAYAFYKMENVEVNVKSSFFGSNAFFAGENGKFSAGNSGMRIVGHATFENGLKTQNGAAVEFIKDEKDEGSVYIKDYLDILNEDNPVTFDVNVFVDGMTTIQNLKNEIVFKKDVGFNGNFYATRTTGFSGDVWLNGDLKNTSGQHNNQVILNGNNKVNNFYYTSKIYMDKSIMGCDICPYPGCTPGVDCCPHIDCKNHPVRQSTQITNFSNMTDTYKKPNEINTDVILDALKMDPLENRKEPDLALDKSHIGEGKEFLSFTKQQPDGYGKYSINGDELNTFYNKTVNDPAYSKYYTDDGHLLLHVDGSVGTDGGTFNGKVILKVEGNGAQINETGGKKFYNSGSEASTLVYVGKDGRLNDFGCGENGNFRGLIYVDPEVDTLTQVTFKWGLNSTLDGAVLLKGGKLVWNSTSNSAMTTIRRDNEVLSNYGFLVKGDTNQNKKETTLVDPAGGIKLAPLGYYFF